MGSRGYDLFWGSLLRATTRSHTLLHRASGGRLGRRFVNGQQVVWVTTVGRRSGLERTVPLLAVREDGKADGAWLVTGSNAGQATAPAWVHNMRATPTGSVDVDGHRGPARFEEVGEPDRTRLYAQLAQSWGAYAMYARHAGREIPVFRVIPCSADLTEGS